MTLIIGNSITDDDLYDDCAANLNDDDAGCGDRDDGGLNYHGDDCRGALQGNRVDGRDKHGGDDVNGLLLNHRDAMYDDGHHACMLRDDTGDDGARIQNRDYGKRCPNDAAN